MNINIDISEDGLERLKKKTFWPGLASLFYFLLVATFAGHVSIKLGMPILIIYGLVALGCVLLVVLMFGFNLEQVSLSAYALTAKGLVVLMLGLATIMCWFIWLDGKGGRIEISGQFLDIPPTPFAQTLGSSSVFAFSFLLAATLIWRLVAAVKHEARL